MGKLCVSGPCTHACSNGKADQDWQVVAMDYAGSFISTTPLAELVAFIAIPAYKQTVFVAGADLVFQVFVVTVARKFAKWAVQTEFAQEFMQNVTKTVVESRAKEVEWAKLKEEL